MRDFIENMDSVSFGEKTLCVHCNSYLLILGSRNFWDKREDNISVKKRDYVKGNIVDHCISNIAVLHTSKPQ